MFEYQYIRQNNGMGNPHFEHNRHLMEVLM
jgi:hypothetical protein